MIEVSLSKDEYSYDIHSLVKAFYPFEQISMTRTNNPDMLFQIIYENDGIRINAIDKLKETVTSDFKNTDFDNKRETKNILKRQLYNILSDVTDKKLPWGTLTGIRPVHTPFELMLEGYSDKEIYNYMKEKFLSENTKIKLSMEVAHTELNILSKMDYKNGYSLYIGIPFCPTKCLYCSFTSFPADKWEPYMDSYIEALFKEIDFVKETMKREPDTVYIGGGTPTSLSADRLDRLIGRLKNTFDFNKIKEFTVEAGRPDSITEEKFLVLKKYNVTRISINPQTMNQKTLELIGRKHTIKDIEDAFFMAREMGFDNINMDLIVGLPGEIKEDVEYTMECIKRLAPDSLTVHSLAIKRAARLNIFKEDYSQYKMINTAQIIDMTNRCAKDMGLIPYYLYRQKNMAGNFENVGYSKPGKECLYNILIMEEKQTILALGAGGVSKKVYPDGTTIRRCDNVKDIKNYLDRIDEMIERKRKLLGGE